MGKIDSSKHDSPSENDVGQLPRPDPKVRNSQKKVQWGSFIGRYGLRLDFLRRRFQSAL